MANYPQPLQLSLLFIGRTFPNCIPPPHLMSLRTACLPMIPHSSPNLHRPPLPSSSLMFPAWLLGDGSCENLPIGLAEGRDKQKGSWELFEACWEKESERKRWQRLRKRWSRGSAAPWRAGRGFLGKGGEIWDVSERREERKKRSFALGDWQRKLTELCRSHVLHPRLRWICVVPSHALVSWPLEGKAPPRAKKRELKLWLKPCLS